MPPLIRGHLDTPHEEAAVLRRRVLIEGWALVDDRPATSVVITANEVVVGTARVGTARPDISAGFGDSEFERCGFVLSVDLTDIEGDNVQLSAFTFANGASEVLCQAALIGHVTVCVLESIAMNTPNLDERSLHAIAAEKWYYSVELAPNVVAEADDLQFGFPLLPRMMIRKCNLDGADCLDLGSMEGLLPVLMGRQGARSVLATDFDDSAIRKIDAVRHAYQADFDFQSVGLMYDLHQKLPGRGFDLINCSGLLYHTWSPLNVLASVRPLLRRNGLMIVSTFVYLDDTASMKFNQSGQLNDECNTFWLMSIGMLEYSLRYLRLEPFDVLYFTHNEIPRFFTRDDLPSTRGQPSPGERRAYVSVLCRATDDSDSDDWMKTSARGSIEYAHSTDWSEADSQRESRIGTTEAQRGYSASSLIGAIQSTEAVPSNVARDCTHFLRLADER